jgi:hypothetical protein
VLKSRASNLITGSDLFLVLTVYRLVFCVCRCEPIAVLPTHVLPRCLPTPTEEADGNGYGVIAGRGGSPEAAAQSKR